MKVTPDDPRLSAYLLGELPSDEASMIRRAAAADPAIRMSLDELEKTVGFLGGVFHSAGSETLLPTQREAIRQAGRDADSLGQLVELPSAQRSWRPWIGALGAAAAVAFAALLMSRVEPDKSSMGMAETGLLTDEIALLPMPGPAVGEGSTSVASRSGSMEQQARSLESRPGGFLSDVARHLDRGPLPDPASLPLTGLQSGFADGPQSRLPVIVGTSSLRWVGGWIREKRVLPPRNAVRVEELINNAALSGGSDAGGLKVAVESMKCPWNADSLLVGVQLKAGEVDEKDLTVVFDSVVPRRVLGSFSVRNNEELPSVLPAKRRTLVMLELKGTTSALGSIEIKQGEESHRLEVLPAKTLTSAGMRHAAALAGFGMWLRTEGVTAEQVRSMLDAAAEDSDPVRSEVRRMMAEGLKLAESER